jgi:hypothetical protein
LLLCTPQAIWHLHRWLGLEELDAGIELCIWGFLHGAARLGHCRHTGTQPGQWSGWICLWCWLPIPSNRGGSKLCYQGYMYTKHATRKTNQWWKCVKRSSIGCRGNLSTTLQNENPVPGQSFMN